MANVLFKGKIAINIDDLPSLEGCEKFYDINDEKIVSAEEVKKITKAGDIIHGTCYATIFDDAGYQHNIGVHFEGIVDEKNNIRIMKTEVPLSNIPKKLRTYATDEAWEISNNALYFAKEENEMDIDTCIKLIKDKDKCKKLLEG